MELVKAVTGKDAVVPGTLNSWDVLQLSTGGSWEVRLPSQLADYQDELESLLGRVFSGSSRLPENFALAVS